MFIFVPSWTENTILPTKLVFHSPSPPSPPPPPPSPSCCNHTLYSPETRTGVSHFLISLPWIDLIGFVPHSHWSAVLSLYDKVLHRMTLFSAQSALQAYKRCYEETTFPYS